MSTITSKSGLTESVGSVSFEMDIPDGLDLHQRVQLRDFMTEQVRRLDPAGRARTWQDRLSMPRDPVVTPKYIEALLEERHLDADPTRPQLPPDRLRLRVHPFAAPEIEDKPGRYCIVGSLVVCYASYRLWDEETESYLRWPVELESSRGDTTTVNVELYVTCTWSAPIEANVGGEAGPLPDAEG